MRGKKTETETVDAGSGDVLVDLGFPDAEPEHSKRWSEASG
jgi:hypothetical protein